MSLQPYLFFNGRCDEAIAFYEQAVGAAVMMRMTHGDNPQPPPAGVLAAGWESKVMHAELKIGDASLLVSDGHGPEPAKFTGFALSLTVSNEADAEQKFAALAESGQVTMPLGPTFFSPRFGMLVDRFGVAWIIYVAA